MAEEHPGVWREIPNSGATVYGDFGLGNLSGVIAEDQPWQGFPASATLVLPPLATVWLEADGDGAAPLRGRDDVKFQDRR